MKFLKDVFARIWAVWGLVSFIATFLLIYIPAMLTYLIPGNRGQYLFILISQLWIRMWLFLVACPLKVRGQDNFKEGEIYIVTCNHNSFLEVYR